MPTYEIRTTGGFLGDEIEIADDEVLLDAELRGGNRVLVAVGTPVDLPTESQSAQSDDSLRESADDTHVCGHDLGDGERCSREVERPDGTCWQHGGDGDV